MLLRKFLSSRKMTLILLSGWAISIVYAYFFIPPRDDDGIYLLPALYVANGLPPGFFIEEEFVLVFFIFPFQVLLNGQFLSLVQPDLYNYRLLNLILILPLLISTGSFIKLLFKDDEKTNLPFNLFLIILAASPFTTNFYVNRPDILGLLFFILGLLVVTRNLQTSTPRSYSTIASFLFLGLSCISHPAFIILTLPIVIFLFYKLAKTNTSLWSILICCFSFSFPLLLFFLWFYINLDTSFPQLFNRTSGIANSADNPLLEGVLLLFKKSFFITDKDLLYKIYDFFLSFPFLFSLSLILWNIRSNPIFLKNFILVLLNIGCIVIVMTQPFPGPMMTASYLMMILLSVFLINFLKVNKQKKLARHNRIFSSFLIILLCLVPITPLFVHASKVHLTNQNYFDSKKTSDIVINSLLKEDKLIITTPQLIPPFTSYIYETITKDKRDDFYWLFPGGQTEKPPFQIESLFKNQLESVLELPQNKSIWGLSKESIVFTSEKSVCFTLRGQLASIKLYNIKKIHEDRDNIFYRPEYFSVYKIIGNCSEEIIL